jgi:ubiquilin
MMADPNAQQALNEVLNNPDVVNHLIESNPMLRNVPNAREIIQSPFMRQMMTNPQMMTQMMRMRRNMAGGGGGGAFPAPGATDNTPADGSAATGDANATGNANAQANPFMNPFMMMPGMGGLGGGEGGQDGGLMNMLAQMQAAQTQSFQAQRAQGGAAAGEAATGTTTSPGAGATTGTQDSSTPGQGGAQNQPPANPFAALFGAPGAGAAGAGAGAGANPFGMTPEMMQSMLQMMGGGGGGAPAGPPDNRPPEERYADQLRQLNDMGFFDFDRNVAALRRSGGSVQGAIEHLLNATD